MTKAEIRELEEKKFLNPDYRNMIKRNFLSVKKGRFKHKCQVCEKKSKKTVGLYIEYWGKYTLGLDDDLMFPPVHQGWVERRFCICEKCTKKNEKINKFLKDFEINIRKIELR
jgi:hypothetical protein